MLLLDLERTPYSPYGAYLSVALDNPGSVLTVRNLHNSFADSGRVATLSFERDGSPVEVTFTAVPWGITVTAAGGGSAVIHIAGDNQMIVRAVGVDVAIRSTFKRYGYGYAENAVRYRIRPVVDRDFLQVDIVEGSASHSFPVKLVDGYHEYVHPEIVVRGEPGTAVLTTTEDERHDPAPVVDLDASLERARAEWEAYVATIPHAWEQPESYLLAWYVLSASTVRAEGFLVHDATLMSATRMASLWSWDHCFNAIAIAQRDVLAGFEQLMIPFSQQRETGMLPDAINDRMRIFLLTKPPIHGWALRYLLEQHEFGEEQLLAAYEALSKWTDFWLTHRAFDDTGLPCYVHGNECADNSTMFDSGEPLQSPDLLAYLAIQTQVLGEIAGRLGRDEERQQFADKSASLVELMDQYLWRDGAYRAREVGGQLRDAPTTIVGVMPLVLGDRLDQDKFALLAARLETDFLTEHGPASEALSSPDFWPTGGYGMRGPIWAPYVLLLADGLRRGGRDDLARSLAERFVRTVENAGAMFEDFEPLSGKGRDDSAYTWTASVYIALRNDFMSGPWTASAE